MKNVYEIIVLSIELIIFFHNFETIFSLKILSFNNLINYHLSFEILVKEQKVELLRKSFLMGIKYK